MSSIIFLTLNDDRLSPPSGVLKCVDTFRLIKIQFCKMF